MTTTRSFVIPIVAVLFCNFCQAVPAISFGLKKPAAAVPQTENMEIRDKWAIVVGINRFSDAAIPPLKFANKSSADLARAIKDTDYGHFAQNHVLVLNGPTASKAAIEQSFNEWLFKKAMPDDLVLIYFNTRVLKNGAGEAVLCANDTETKDLDKTGINLTELLINARQRVGSTHMICLLDTNPATEKAETPSHDLKWLASNAGMAVFSAADLFKPSLDDATNMQTYFIHFLLEALKTGGAKYPVAIVAEYVWQKIQETTKSSIGPGQNPVLSLSSEHSGTAAIPIGIMVRSSLPPKTIAFGHPLDTLALDRPDIIAPTMNPAKSVIKLQSRNQPGVGAEQPGADRTATNQTATNQTATNQTAANQTTANPTTANQKGNVMAAAASRPNFVAVAPVSATKSNAKPLAASPAKTRETVDDEDDDDNDNVDPNLDLRPYVAKVKVDIQKKWQAPKGFESKHVTTTFSIMRDGKISNASIFESSGNATLDESALAALKGASPLDPLPKGSPPSVDIRYVFDWKTKIGSQ